MGGLGLSVAGFPAETALKVLRGLLVGRPVAELVLDVVAQATWARAPPYTASSWASDCTAIQRKRQ